MASVDQLGAPSSSSTNQRLSCWPNEREFLLLQAGLLDPARSIRAWRCFCESVPDIERLDDGCYRLFPLVAANLQKCGRELPHLHRINGTLRHAWAKNQRLFATITPQLRALQEAKIDLLLLKGAALGGAYRQRNCTRFMEDVDILIRPHDLKRAVAILGQTGFRPEREMSMESLSDLLRFRHELTVRNADGIALDIHWYLAEDTYDLVADDLFWKDAVPCQMADFSGRSLNASDQFVHTSLHGAQWNEVSPVRWLADATLLMESGVDWRRVEEQAKRLRQLGPVRDTVLFLVEMGVELPGEMVNHWRKMEVTAIEKLENGFRAWRPNDLDRTRQLAWVYLRISRKMSGAEMIFALPAYVRQIHHFRSYSRLIKFLFYLAFLLFRGERRRI
jgi:hypothetical protein